jgi:hypothetical protein
MDDLLLLLDNSQSEGERKRIEAAVVSVIGKFPDMNDGTAKVIRHMSETKSIEVNYSVLRILSSTGSTEAYKILSTALNGEDETAQKIVIESLSNWPGDEPIEDLMKVAETTPNRTYKILAIRSYVTLVKRSKKLTEDDKVANYESALKLSEADNEKKMIVSGIGDIYTLESLKLASSLLDEDNLRKEVIRAVLQISEEIAGDHPEEVKNSVQKVLEISDNEWVVEYANEILGSIK